MHWTDTGLLAVAAIVLTFVVGYYSYRNRVRAEPGMQQKLLADRARLEERAAVHRNLALEQAKRIAYLEGKVEGLMIPRRPHPLDLDHQTPIRPSE